MKKRYMLLLLLIFLFGAVFIIDGFFLKEKKELKQVQLISIVDRRDTLQSRQSRTQQIFDLVDQY